MTNLIMMLVTMLSPANQTQEIPSHELYCLAQNVYFEARNQSDDGQYSVAFVTMNRVKSNRFKNSICGVVRQGYKPGRRDCHFSWYCDGKPDAPTDPIAWSKAVSIAYMVVKYGDHLVDPTNGSTHYHATYVSPWWSKQLALNTTIGDHIFYTEH